MPSQIPAYLFFSLSAVGNAVGAARINVGTAVNAGNGPRGHTLGKGGGMRVHGLTSGIPATRHEMKSRTDLCYGKQLEQLKHITPNPILLVTLHVVTPV